MVETSEHEREKAKGMFRSWLSRLSSTFHFRSNSRTDSPAELPEIVDQNDAIDIFLKQNPSFEQFRDDLSKVAVKKSYKKQFRFNKVRWEDVSTKCDGRTAAEVEQFLRFNNAKQIL